MFRGNTADWLLKTVWTLIFDWHNRAFAHKALKVIDGKYDVVFCTAFSDFPLGAAKIIAKKLHLPLICDIRDLDEQVDDSRYQYHHQQWWLMPFRKLYRAIHIRRRNNVLRSADTITTVSTWHAEFIKQFNSNTHIVYNGFDERQFFAQNIKTNQFTISYIGSLFEWQQSALKTVKQALEQLQLPVVLDIHTPKNNPIAHDQLGQAINRSSIMLVFTSPNTHGMLTTKFYEALGCEKPILCVPSDKGELAALIQHTNAGIATDNIDSIKTFITDKYNEWQKQGFTHQKVQHKEQFSRDFESKQIEQLLK